jgi:hypothetical protein
MSKMYKARTTTIVQTNNATRRSRNQSTNKVFPVTVTYKEPDPTFLLEYEASLANRHAVGPKGGKLRKRKSTRADGTNPRAKGTNPRAKAL